MLTKSSVEWAFMIFITIVFSLSCSNSDDKDLTNQEPEPSTQNPTDPSTTPDINFDIFEEEVLNLMSNDNIMGAQIAITKNEKLVYLKSFGIADIENDIPVINSSLFRVASVSKSVTALAILKLVSENRMQLSDKVFGTNALLGTDYGSLEYSEDEKRITLKHLLEHKSGFRNEPYDIMFDAISLTHKNLIDEVLDNREPVLIGQYYYSNFGYCLLGRIIEKISNKTYEEYVKEEVLKPLGIVDMHIGGNTLEERLESEVKYYSNWFDPYQMNVTRMDSHGGWIASAKDLAYFNVGSDGKVQVNDLLDSEEMDLYYSIGLDNYNGALPGTTAIIGRSGQFTFAMLYNSGGNNFESVHNKMRNLLTNEITSRGLWPLLDLFE